LARLDVGSAAASSREWSFKATKPKDSGRLRLLLLVAALVGIALLIRFVFF
jgi:hypothetical protein